MYDCLSSKNLKEAMKIIKDRVKGGGGGSEQKQSFLNSKLENLLDLLTKIDALS